MLYLKNMEIYKLKIVFLLVFLDHPHFVCFSFLGVLKLQGLLFIFISGLLLLAKCHPSPCLVLKGLKW